MEPIEIFDEPFFKSQAFMKRPQDWTWWDYYCRKGWQKGLSPHPLFDVKWYLENNPDVKQSGEEPLCHYLHKGWREGRDPNPYFQTDWYIANNPELLDEKVNPLVHYLEKGWKAGCDPGPKFSISRYYRESPFCDREVEPLSDYIDHAKKAKTNKNEYSHWPIVYLPTGNEPLKIKECGRIAVQLHAFYTDELGVILDHLKFIPFSFDLLVSTDSQARAMEIEKIVTESRVDCSLEICCSENRGRDVAPLVCLFGRKLLNYEIALHVHTKKSQHSKNNQGHSWLMHNLGFLLRSQEYVKGILRLFLENPHCGTLLPKPWKGIRDGMAWTINREHAENLMERLKLSKIILNAHPLMFPGGTMFWFRPAALKPLFASDLTYGDFPLEPIHHDGTIAHAIERSICYIALSQGYHSFVVSPSIYKPAL